MGKLSLWRLGFCSRGNGPVQKVDPAFLFEIGDTVRAIRRLTPTTDKIRVFFTLNDAKQSINTCVYNCVYSSHFHGPLFAAASQVTDTIDQIIQKLYPDEEGKEAQDIDQFDLMGLNTVYTKFETIFISELQTQSVYLVTKKGGFDTDAMVDAGRVFFSSDLSAKVPDAVADLEQAMRCIAFEVPTAAGFHLHRANEAVLRVYWDNVTAGQARPKQNNMGVYLDGLRGRFERG